MKRDERTSSLKSSSFCLSLMAGAECFFGELLGGGSTALPLPLAARRCSGVRPASAEGASSSSIAAAGAAAGAGACSAPSCA